MDEKDFGNTILSKSYSVGSVHLIDMRNNMWAVVAFDDDNNLLSSRNFAYTSSTEKEVWASCRKHFKKIKECLYQKRLDMIDEI